MSKYNWPQVQVDPSLTDPDKVRQALGPVFGETLANMVRDQLAEAIKTLGLDTIDRRHLATLNSGGASPSLAGGAYGANGRPRYTQYDAIDPRGWDLPQVRAHRYELVRSWFRFALCGTPFNAENSLGPDVDPTLVRVLSTTDSAGGVLIPPGFIPELTRDIPKLTQLFKYVRIVPVTLPNGPWPKVGTNATVYWGTENVAIDEGDPAFDEDEYTVRRLNALLKLSREVVSDSNPAIVTVVGDLFQMAMAEEKDRVIAVGSGVAKPLGLYSATGITNVSITSLTYANLVKLKHSVDQRYHFAPSFRWSFNQNVLAAIEQLVDTMGQPIFRDATANMSATVLGTPFSVEKSFPNNYIGIGDLGYYAWFDQNKMGAERTTEGGDAFLKHQVWMKWFEYVDGRPILPPTKPMARTRVLTGVSSLT